MKTSTEHALAKVPEVTLGFWLIKIAATTLGETGGDAVSTKLELTKAYLEIGDKDGAREILQEVAKEGSAAQKDEAQKLIASL